MACGKGRFRVRRRTVFIDFPRERGERKVIPRHQRVPAENPPNHQKKRGRDPYLK